MFDYTVITNNIGLLWQGLLMTLYFTVITIAAGMAIGLVVGLVQLTTFRPLALLGQIYVEFFRNIPLLVTLLWVYYALPIFAGINITKSGPGLSGSAATSVPSTPKSCVPAYSRSIPARRMPRPRSACPTDSACVASSCRRRSAG